MTRELGIALAALALCGGAHAQSFNIDFGQTGAGPPDDYAAAGTAGRWNRIAAEHTSPSTAPQPFDYQLVDVHGLATDVGLHQFGGMTWFSTDDPALDGDDANLLEDGLVTFSPTLESCLYLNGLQPGVYEVLIYAWMPAQSAAVARVRVDNHPPPQTVAGAWPGAHQQGVTYGRFLVTVGPDGFMGPHAGIDSSSDPLLGGALNGIQLRRLCDGCFTSFCSGDGSGAACPCANPGSPDRGCANSAGAAGGLLTASGSSVVSNDTVRLQASGLVPNTTALFFQGETILADGDGVPFGDGLRCTGVGVLRLGIRSTGPGAVDLGDGISGDPAISAIGQVPAAGGARYYQVWYRDPQGVCASGSFNLTNGLAIDWAP